MRWRRAARRLRRDPVLRYQRLWQARAEDVGRRLEVRQVRVEKRHGGIIASSAGMTRALELAARGRYTTQPNPRVGCVVVAAALVRALVKVLRGGRVTWRSTAYSPT